MEADTASAAELPIPAAGGRPLPPFEGDATALLVALADWVRPDDPDDGATAAARVRELAGVLRGDPRALEAVRAAVAGSVQISAGIPLFAESGILSPRGFAGEVIERLYERVLPAPAQPGALLDTFERMFSRRGDARWASGVPAAAWGELGAVIDEGVAPGTSVMGVLRPGMLGAIELARELLGLFRRRPREFFLPPRVDTA